MCCLSSTPWLLLLPYCASVVLCFTILLTCHQEQADKGNAIIAKTDLKAVDFSHYGLLWQACEVPAGPSEGSHL